MKTSAKFTLLAFAILILIACNIPGSDNDRREQEYNYKLEQKAQEVAATETARSQSGLDVPDPSNDAPAISQSESINTEAKTESNATTPKMVFKGTGTVMNYYWGTEDLENTCTSEAKVTLTVEGDICTTDFTYPEMGMGIDKECIVLWDDVRVQVTGPYSSTDGSCLFNTMTEPISDSSVTGSGVLLGAAKVEFWEQTSVADWVKHYYSGYLSLQP